MHPLFPEAPGEPQARGGFRATLFLGYVKDGRKGKRRHVIHLVCERSFWTYHAIVFSFDLYSIKHMKVVPKETRLAEL
jgi:hypothetical protein